MANEVNNEVKTVTLGIFQGALTEVPNNCYRDHSRGKNWLAVIEMDPKSPGGLERIFCTRANGDYFYFTDKLAVGQVVEFGADYYSGSGRRSPTRKYFVVAAISENGLTLKYTDDSDKVAAFELAEQLKVQVASKEEKRVALEAERATLLARLAEINAELGVVEPVTEVAPVVVEEEFFLTAPTPKAPKARKAKKVAVTYYQETLFDLTHENMFEDYSNQQYLF